jgi:mono/diheme cytochrome c family protein
MHKVLFAAALAVCAVATGARAETPLERGKYLVETIMACGNCHTPQGPDGPIKDRALSGGPPIEEDPHFIARPSNITPDRETGIGAWTDAEIVAAIRNGYARGKGVEAPVMPYYQYAGMADRDVRDLVAYLRTLAAVKKRNRDADVNVPLPRLAYRAWRFLFADDARPPAEAPADEIARGHYLVDHVAACGDCHTPRTRFGSLDKRLYLAGTVDGPDGNPVPNITTDDSTGIGKWDFEDLTQVLSSGMMPNFDNVQGLMAEVVDGTGGGPGYAQAPAPELRAIAKYLKTISAVEHDVSEK